MAQNSRGKSLLEILWASKMQEECLEKKGSSWLSGSSSLVNLLEKQNLGFEKNIFGVKIISKKNTHFFGGKQTPFAKFLFQVAHLFPFACILLFGNANWSSCWLGEGIGPLPPT